jgi:leader peptidase (prepilin peptidase) / N-methyltransferase
MTVAESIFLSSWGVAFATVWGALWGSFINVVIIRVPLGESIVRPPSACRHCKTELRWYHNIPILSYVALRGKCQFCGAAVSSRYPIIEALLALLSVGAYFVFVLSSDAVLGMRMARFVLSFAFTGVLVALSVIDLDTERIPNVITYPAIPIAVLASVFMGWPNVWDGAVGAVAGYLLIRLVADGYQLLRGQVGMGYGDAKLLSLIGGFLGWQIVLPTLFLSSILGTFIGIPILFLIRRRSSEEQGSIRHAALRFGPFIAAAALILLVVRILYAMHLAPWLELGFVLKGLVPAYF